MNTPKLLNDAEMVKAVRNGRKVVMNGNADAVVEISKDGVIAMADGTYIAMFADGGKGRWRLVEENGWFDVDVIVSARNEYVLNGLQPFGASLIHVAPSMVGFIGYVWEVEVNGVKHRCVSRDCVQWNTESHSFDALGNCSADESFDDWLKNTLPCRIVAVRFEGRRPE